jgi:membrane-associated protein
MQPILDLVNWFIDFVLHMDKHLPQMVSDMGIWIYLVLFIIIFIETGVVVMPFLPVDSLLFAAGAVAASTELNIFALAALMAVAAILGDTANYWIGHFIGPKVFTQKSRWFKKEYLDRTVAFYEKHGGKTIFLARFVPIIRTFAPFVAGIGRMRYGYFISYNIVGGIVWTSLFLAAGYFFGNLPIVQENFSLVVIMIILISLVPAVYEVAKEKFARKAPAAE